MPDTSIYFHIVKINLTLLAKSAARGFKEFYPSFGKDATFFNKWIIVPCSLQHMVPYIWELPLPKRCKGVSHISVSPNSKYVAFGTYQGRFFRISFVGFWYAMRGWTGG